LTFGYNIMIDRVNRNRLAQSVRQLVSGRMTNLEFDELDVDGTADSGDPAIREVSHYIWHFYDDFKVHRLEISNGTRQDFSRAILFLHSNLEFEWPHEPALKRFLRSIVSRFHRIDRERIDRERLEGNLRYWPFYRKSDYQKALLNPRLLAGSAEQDAAVNP